MHRLFCIAFISISLSAFSQKRIKGIVADSSTRQPLPFATIKTDGQQKNVFTGINGQFSFFIPANSKQITVTYISYNSKIIPVAGFRDNDTIFLSPSISTLGEVIIKPQKDKIRRIIDMAVRNKPLHNPDKYEEYQCNLYYKMKLDLTLSEKAMKDSSRIKTKTTADKNEVRETEDSDFEINQNYLFFSETYSKRLYRRPEMLQEIVIASRVSGLKKTYFTSLVTDVLPFHVYSDYIPLSSIDYINPISKGWRQRYDFYLIDEIVNENDTTYIFSFSPKKNVAFNGLKGQVYINSDGYAISHIICSDTDTLLKREVRIEQVYERVGGRWFPKELNYDVIYNEFVNPDFKFQINGRSAIDSVLFKIETGTPFNKAYTVRLGDSVDLHSEKEWVNIRPDTLTFKEKNTYRIIDSLSEKFNLEKIMTSTAKLMRGRLPYRFVDIDLMRLLASNSYEGKRLGLGLYTNEKISNYYELGASVGYGTRDGKFKYGFSATSFFKANKDNWLRVFYNHDYQNAGNIIIHSEIDRGGYRRWLLSTPDKVREFGVTTHVRKGYWEIELDGRKKKLEALYENNFFISGTNYKEFDIREASIGLRYAYGEKREPVFGIYFGSGTKYPIVYFRAGFGSVNSEKNYSADYIRALLAADFTKHINRWGNDHFRIEAGITHSFKHKPLPRSFLLASKGFRRDGTNFYAWGGFLTMQPFDFYTDRYISFHYKHDIDKFLWQLKISKPFFSILHNSMIGDLRIQNLIATREIKWPVNGYHESGFIVNQLLRKRVFNSAYLNVNAGACYRWTSFLDGRKNGVFLLGFSFGL